MLNNGHTFQVCSPVHFQHSAAILAPHIKLKPTAAGLFKSVFFLQQMRPLDW